jgi:hypothetical protein
MPSPLFLRSRPRRRPFSLTSLASLASLAALVVTAGCAARAPESGEATGAIASSSSKADATPAVRATLSTLTSTLRPRPELAARFAPTASGFAASGARFSSLAARTPSLDPKTALAPRLAVELADRADQPLRLALARDASIAATLTPLDHAAVAGALDEGRVVYRDVAPSTDAIVASGEGWAELAWVLRDAQAPARFRFRAAAAPGLRWEAEGGEGLALVDEGGRARLHVAPPIAIDARGVRREATLRLDGDAVSVALDPRGLAYPIVLDPYIGTASWVRQIVDPPRREGPAMATIGGSVILFGGQGSAGPLGDGWSFDGVRWTPQLASAAPPARAYAVAGNAAGKAVLFGGGDGKADLHDTWTFDGATWTQVTTAHTPSLLHPTAAASLGAKLYALGDDGAGGAKLWSFDGADWTQEADGLAADAAGHLSATATELVYVASSTSDTWTWKYGAGWKKVVTASGSPEYAAIGAMAAIGGAPTIVDRHLSAFRWTGSAWTKTITGDASFEWSIEGGAGGAKLHFLAAPFLGGRQELWACDGATITQVHPEDAPQVSLGQDAFAVSAARSRATYLGDPRWTWEWDGKRWSRTARPSGMGIVFGMAGRGSTAIALLFGSSTTTLDTWSWDGSAWTKLTPAHPIAHDGFMPWMATIGDAASPVPVVVSPAGDGSSTTASKWDGADWVTIGTQAARPIAFGAFAASGVLFGATGADAETVSEYRLSPTGWTTESQRAVPALKAFAVRGEVATIGARALLHTVGAATPMKEWLTTDSAWAAVAIGGLSPRRQAHLATFGATVLHFGGADEDGAPADDLHALTTTLEYGVACGGDAECSSGVCAQGVCCNRACDGAASRCDLPETLGSCTPLKAACTSPTQLKGADGTDTDCTPYLCQAGGCLQKCTTSSECAGGYICDTASQKCTQPAASDASNGGCATRGPSETEGTGGARWGLAMCALVVASAVVARRRRARS